MRIAWSLISAAVALSMLSCFSTDALIDPCPKGLASDETGVCSCPPGSFMVPESEENCTGLLTLVADAIGDPTRSIVEVELFDDGNSRRVVLLERSSVEAVLTVYELAGTGTELNLTLQNTFRAPLRPTDPFIDVLPEVTGLEVLTVASGVHFAFVMFFDGHLMAADLSQSGSMVDIPLAPHDSVSGFDWVPEKIIVSALTSRQEADAPSSLIVYTSYSESGLAPPDFSYYMTVITLEHTPNDSVPITARFNPTAVDIAPPRTLSTNPPELFGALVLSFDRAQGSTDAFTASGAAVVLEVGFCGGELCQSYNESNPILFDVRYNGSSTPPSVSVDQAPIPQEPLDEAIDLAMTEFNARFEDDGSRRSRENFSIVILTSGSVSKNVVAVGVPVFIGCLGDDGVPEDCASGSSVAEQTLPVYSPSLFFTWRRADGFVFERADVVKDLAVGALRPLDRSGLGLSSTSDGRLFASNVLRRVTPTAKEIIFSLEILDTSEGIVSRGAIESERINFEPLLLPSMVVRDNLIFLSTDEGLKIFQLDVPPDP